MDVLYSDILPLGLKDGQQTIAETIKHQMELADEVRIAVGYVSAASLDELDQMVESCSIKRISLVMGMYYTEGMNERAYRRAVKLHQKWAAGKIGSVKAVLPFKYHGKVYCFYQNGQPARSTVHIDMVQYNPTVIFDEGAPTETLIVKDGKVVCLGDK